MVKLLFWVRVRFRVRVKVRVRVRVGLGLVDLLGLESENDRDRTPMFATASLNKTRPKIATVVTTAKCSKILKATI